MIGLVTCTAIPLLTNDDRPLPYALARAGQQAAPVAWNDEGVNWGAFDLLVLRSCWDYHRRHQEFLSWLSAREAEGIAVVNAPQVVRWNLHKKYLAPLAASGIRVPESAMVARGSEQSLASVLAVHRWGDAIVKPAIGASADGVWRISSREGLDEHRFREANASMDLLVQRFVPEVLTDGEWSLVFLDGEYSHAVLKRPATGDFRVQSEFGGAVVPRTPGPGMVAWAEDVARRIPGDWCYARVDAVVTARGCLLMEIECIEPELFFGSAPGAADAMARLLVQRVTAGRAT